MTDKSTDLVQRIRARPNDAPLPTERLLDEAANEIEALRMDIRVLARLAEHAIGREEHETVTKALRQFLEYMRDLGLAAD